MLRSSHHQDDANGHHLLHNANAFHFVCHATTMHLLSSHGTKKNDDESIINLTLPRGKNHNNKSRGPRGEYHQDSLLKQQQSPLHHAPHCPMSQVQDSFILHKIIKILLSGSWLLRSTCDFVLARRTGRRGRAPRRHAFSRGCCHHVLRT